VVAALDHVDVVADPGPTRGRERLAVRVVVARLQGLDEGPVLTDRHHRIQLREALQQPVAFLLDYAAGDGDGPLRGLPLAQLVQLGVNLVLRLLTDDAGVEDSDVGPLEVLLFRIAGRQELSREALRVRQVHLAPDRPDVERASFRAQRSSTRRRMPVLSSPSIEMSMKEGMQTSSMPAGAT